MAATQSTDPALMSPKVKASAWTGLLLTVLAAALVGITPDMLAFLGPWAGPVFLGLGALAQAIAAQVKSDPARDALTVAVPPGTPLEQTPTGMPPAGFHAIELPDDGTPGRHEALPA